MKKRISLVLIVLVLILTQSLSSVSAVSIGEESNKFEPIHVDGYTFEVVTENEDYYKIRILNDKTKQVEYLEWIKDEGGKAIFIATDSKGNQTTITDEDIAVTFQENKIDTSNNIIGSITPLAEDPGGGGGSDPWRPAGGWRASKSFYYSTFSTCLGLLTGFLSGAVASSSAAYAVGSTTSIATFMYGAGINDVWFDTKTFYNVNDTCELKDSVLAYRYSNYTGFMGATTRYWRNCRW